MYIKKKLKKIKNNQLSALAILRGLSLILLSSLAAIISEKTRIKIIGEAATRRIMIKNHMLSKLP